MCGCLGGQSQQMGNAPTKKWPSASGQLLLSSEHTEGGATDCFCPHRLGLLLFMAPLEHSDGSHVITANVARPAKPISNGTINAKATLRIDTKTQEDTE